VNYRTLKGAVSVDLNTEASGLHSPRQAAIFATKQKLWLLRSVTKQLFCHSLFEKG
jgi:hypothetical protein